MATVPVGTQLYHGTSKKEEVKGMEWLAFEPEHALVFARPRGPPRGKRPGQGDEDDHEKERQELRGRRAAENEDDCEMRPDPWSRQGHAHMPAPPEIQGPLHHPPPGHPHGPDNNSPPTGPPRGPPPHHDSHPPPPPPPHHGEQSTAPPPVHDDERQRLLTDDEPPQNPPSRGKGYLHTYIPTRPLRLLYVDGLSAGKTSNGTLDSQDILLLNMTAPPGSPMGGEIARARRLCHLASTLWDKKIDGVLRMEAGFEIILCEFEGTVKRKSVVVYDGERDESPGGPPGGKRGRGVMGGWRYIKAVSERFHGIGGNRVTLDYERFVSVFAYDDQEEEGMGLWDNDVVSDTPHPRLINALPEQLEKVRDAVTRMVLEKSWEEEGRDWQAVADMVVKRYGEAIHYLHTDASVRRSKEAFATYLSALLRPFVSPSARNATLETERCVAQVIPPFPLPPHKSASLAHTTLHTVTAHICSTLINALDASTLTLSRSLAATSSPPYHALDLIDGLVIRLQWTMWKECGSCADDEVCFIPIWPMGSLENHKNPQCVKEDGVGMGYWGGRGGPPPGEGRPGEGRPVHDDPTHARPGPEGPKLRKHQGTEGSGRPSSAHGGRKHDDWEHDGWEKKGRHGDRPWHGGRKKVEHCTPRKHGVPLNHAPDRFHGGWDRGAWSLFRGSLMQVVEWFGSEPHNVEVKVNFVDTHTR
ncbi:uncharacterized protein N0V89_009753 [Didymosphaeria variabile]|uniref:Uncharacterized protein n=1 Tax=Didymosphaeria variabile TaxID=1932322 RepID=A0A9W8XEY4_9PLEO|nr:uncharacterized protein N0V89_009753 [Didymosphaeria variabile]KAJ4348379.1 hypothetical protein N0V89_009753 [Didymosphaeria variabile]